MSPLLKDAPVIIPTDPVAADAAREMIAWASAPPPADPLQDLTPLWQRLQNIDGLGLTTSEYHRTVELFHARAHRAGAELKQRLRSSTHPLARDLQAAAEALSRILGLVARGYRRILEDVEQRRMRTYRRHPVVLCARALECLLDQQEMAALMATPDPLEMWRLAAFFHQESQAETVDAAIRAELGTPPHALFARMLVLGATGAERLSAGETTMALRWLDRVAHQLEIGTGQPAHLSEHWFWLDPEADHPPASLARRPPPGKPGVLFFSCARLAGIAADHATQLDAGIAPATLDLPDQAQEPVFRALLRQLAEHWSTTPRRGLNRRRSRYEVQLCAGLESIWRLLGGRGGAASAEPPRLSEWTVLNDSAGGYGVMHSEGEIAGLVAGSAVAVRTAPDRPWSVCVVRWVRSENGSRLELGLQMVSPSAVPLEVGFRSVTAQRQLRPALLLPPVPALRPNSAILAPAGSYTARRFVLVHQTDKLYVAQCRLLSLDLQTAAVELFQFELDPYPI